MSSNNDGFTLIEVIIASVILFSAIAIGTLAYRTSVSAMDRVSANTKIATALPDIMETVRDRLKKNVTSGQGTYDSTISYSYTSEMLKEFTEIKGYQSQFMHDVEHGTFNIMLENVKLVIRFEDESYSGTGRYHYKELVWSPLGNASADAASVMTRRADAAS